MANVNHSQRSQIKQVLRWAFDPRMAGDFPASTPGIATGGEPACPNDVDYLRLNIQCTLLPFIDHIEYYFFVEIQSGRATLRSLAERYHLRHQAVSNQIDDMLNQSIIRMKDGTAQMILSVYWEMQRYDSRIPAGKRGYDHD